MKIRHEMTSWEYYENKWFYMKYIGKYFWPVSVFIDNTVPTYSIFQHVYGKHNLVSFYRVESYFDSRITSSFFIFFFFFQEKTLGDISLETKIMTWWLFFFRKKYNQRNSSVVNNMQYNLFTIFPLSGPFAEFFFIRKHAFHVNSL
jgi:hypothetical protein